jgi:cytochrome c556
MYKKLFLISITLWIITAGIFVKFFITGQTSKSTDNRTAIHLSAAEKDVVLGEMRAVLSAINQTIKSLAKEDFKEASIAIKKAGAGMAVDINPALMSKLPLEFKKFGMSMHDDFDSYSESLNKGITQKEALERLGQITNKCVTCHATYRLTND